MDIWKAFRNSTTCNAPSATILFDKFRMLRHLSDALDAVRKNEYARLHDKGWRLIKGQKYTLLSHRKNLTLEGQQALQDAARRQQAVEHGLSPQGIVRPGLWDYQREDWARRFFEQWHVALKWQQLPSYEKFAAMIERHWDGITAYYDPWNKVALRFVEGLNNKIRVLQRHTYGLCDPKYLRLKILTYLLREI